MATNYVQPGAVVALTWSGTSPSAGAPVIKCAGKATGALIGVALNGTGTASETILVATEGVFDLSVTGDAGAIAVGDYIYTTDPADVTVCTASLTNDPNTAANVIFGVALEAVGSGDTDTINVMLRQPAHL